MEDRNKENKKLLDRLKSFREKLTGIQQQAVDYQIKQLEKKLKTTMGNEKLKIFASKKKINAKIYKEKMILEGIQKLLALKKGKIKELKNNEDFLIKKIHFLEIAENLALDTEEKVYDIKTTGNVKFDIEKISINPILKCTKIVVYVDSVAKFELKSDFTGEINMHLNNSIECEIIAFGDNESIIGFLFFGCEAFIYNKERTKHTLEMQIGFLDLYITFEKMNKLIRRQAEILFVNEARHELESFKLFSPFKCCVCHQFTQILAPAFRCCKCKFICHKMCSKFIVFDCLCAAQLDENISKRYNIPHNFVSAHSLGVSWCNHCGMRITMGEKCFKCSSCNFLFHSECKKLVFNACKISFEFRCAISEFNPPVPESENSKQKHSINDFTLIKVLGRGSSGKVMLAKHVTDNKIVALKIIKKEMLVDAYETAYLELERKILNFCTIEDHPFLIRMDYCFQNNRHIFFGTEFLSGGDLFHHAAKSNFTNKQIKLYAAEILLALQFLHKNKILYRDLKLDNILVDKNGHIKLADFGLCKDNLGPFTVTFTYCGTPTTMAPEVILKGGYTKDVDWWSYGIVLYEMFEGELPFDGATGSEIARNILIADIKFSRTPEIAQNLINKLLQRDPKNRIGSGENDAEDIKNHPYFHTINWDDVYNKVYRPPLIPDLKLDENFDQEFIEEEIILTPCSSIVQYNEYFANFK